MPRILSGGTDPGQTTPRQTSPDRHPLGRLLPPPETVSPADVTYPSGMHSCLKLNSIFLNLSDSWKYFLLKLSSANQGKYFRKSPARQCKSLAIGDRASVNECAALVSLMRNPTRQDDKMSAAQDMRRLGSKRFCIMNHVLRRM